MERIEKGFSSWDGSHIALARRVKQTMHNPKSFKHVETKSWDAGDHLKLSMTFRGTNGFGATVVNTVLATATLDGDVIEIIQ